MGFDGVDINMGCPDRGVEKQGAGAALMKNPKLARKLIKAARDGAGSITVSVKTRLGYSKIETDIWIPHLLEAGIDALVVHGRTRKEMSSVPAHWDEMGKITDLAKGSGTLIIGNGDVKSMREVRQKSSDYKLDGIMIGRGIFDNPWFFSEQIYPNKISPQDRIGLMLKHCDNFEKLWGGQNGLVKHFDTMKKFFKIYINGYAGAKEFRTRLMATKNISDVRLIIKNFPLL